MGQSHYKSNIIGKNSIYVASIASITASTLTSGGTVTGVDGTFSGDVTGVNLEGSTSASAPSFNASTKVKAGQYFQMGTHQYVFFGTAPNSTAVISEATAVDASIKGSVYFSACATKAACYFIKTDSSASLLKDVAA